MNNRKRRSRKKETLKKEKKNNLIGFIVLFLVMTSIAIGGPFKAKAINDGNMFFMLLPLIIFAAFIILALILTIRQKLRQKLRQNKHQK